MHALKQYSIFLMLSIIISTYLNIAFAASIDITGAGATLPYPLYAKWAATYYQENGAKVNYQPIGSGGGIKQIESKIVDFGASDKPLRSQELKHKNLLQFPTVISGIVPIINIPGLHPGQLKLSGPILADIFLGKIKKWNDVNIAKINPGIYLPALNITIVHRADSSGSTLIFTNYLSKVSAQWQTQAGQEAALRWPVGIGGKGNEGVAQYVKRVKGAIGYIEYAYARQNNLVYAKLQNKAGYFIEPTVYSFEQAAAHVQWEQTANFYKILTNESGIASWPITGATYILIQHKQDCLQKTKAVLQFFNWVYTHTDRETRALGYAPLPKQLVTQIKQMWKNSLGINVATAQ